MAEVVENTGKVSQYSKITSYEVWNFMSIVHARVEFDERGIINFKGYNDSGKSNMLRALDVCLFNKYPSQQAKFIRDDCNGFRVLINFDDGVSLLRDKYSNGKSLYEMYQNGNCIYSTKQNGVLTKIVDVPEPIANYLGMISHDGIYLNSRTCYDKQLLTDTKGKENYDFFNSVLKSEELSVAGAMLNTDKNKLLSEKSRHEAEYDLVSKNADVLVGVTLDTVAKLEELDKAVDSLDSQATALSNINNLITKLNEIQVLPELHSIDTSKITSLEQIEQYRKTLEQLPDIPELKGVDISRVQSLDSIMELQAELSKIQVTEKELPVVSIDKFKSLEQIIALVNTLSQLDAESKEIENGLLQSQEEVKKLQNTTTHRILVCENCGNVLLDDEVCGNELV